LYEKTSVILPHVMQAEWLLPSITTVAVFALPMPRTDTHAIDVSEVHSEERHCDDEMYARGDQFEVPKSIPSNVDVAAPLVGRLGIAT
jgi:hypothetical protein